MKNFCKRLKAITQAEVIIALVIMSLIILAAKNVTINKLNYAKRVRAYAGYKVISDIASVAISQGFKVEDKTFYHIAPVYRSTGSDSFFCNSKIEGGLHDTLVTNFNVLSNEMGPTFNCDNCGSVGYFTDVTPTMYLSNGMTLYISQDAYSYGMRDVTVTSLASIQIYRNSMCASDIGGGEGKINNLESICAPIAASALDLTPSNVQTLTFTANTAGALYQSNIECPSCSSGSSIKRYKTVELFGFLYGLRYGNNLSQISPAQSCRDQKVIQYINDTYQRFLAGSYYVIFIDTDGPKAGSNTLDDDVMEYYLTLDGRVIPISESRLVTTSSGKNAYLYANLKALKTDGTETIEKVSYPLISAMCHYKYANNNLSYYADNFVPIRNVCPTLGATQCSSAVSGIDDCSFEIIKASVSVRGRKNN